MAESEPAILQDKFGVKLRAAMPCMPEVRASQSFNYRRHRFHQAVSKCLICVKAKDSALSLYDNGLKAALCDIIPSDKAGTTWPKEDSHLKQRNKI
ncbi:MAG: hypothetical protein M0P11_05955 [Anaerolineaceae bacterium]|nr:hypothetical protein [Anaerolineaceae bacterium]